MGIQEDLLSVSEMATGLWPESARADEATLETFSALVMLDLTPERRVVRLAATLLDRAEREGPKAIVSRANDPFYRLDAEERLLLIALYRSKWSYGRLSQVFDQSIEKIQEAAWASRLHLAYAPEVSSGARHLGPVSLIHPTGSPLSGHSCPPYHPGRPWTQRYLDQECLPQERLYFEAHARDCEDCRKALDRARKLYYFVESLVPRPGAEATSRRDRLVQFYENAAEWKSPLNRPLRRTLQIFLARLEVQLALSFLIVLTAYQLFFKE